MSEFHSKPVSTRTLNDQILKVLSTYIAGEFSISPYVYVGGTNVYESTYIAYFWKARNPVEHLTILYYSDLKQWRYLICRGEAEEVVISTPEEMEAALSPVRVIPVIVKD